MTTPRERVAELEAKQDVAALASLGEEAERSRDKDLRREVKRALYRLEQRGVATGRSASAPTPTVSRPFAGEAVGLEAHFSPPDPLGDRLLWILREKTGGGLMHLSLLVNEPEGMRESILADTSRKDLKRLREDMRDRHGLRMVPVSPAYATAIAAEGYERARAKGSPSSSVSSFPTQRLQLGLDAPAAVPALAIPGLDHAEVGADPAAAASSVELLEQELRHWFPPLDRIAPWAQKLREIRDSPIVLDPSSQQGRVEELVQQATVEIFSPEIAPAWRRRLEECAYVLADAGQPDAARKALAAGIAFSRPAAENPFAQEVVRRAFTALTAEEARRQAEQREDSVLVTPDQLREDAARRRR